MALEFAASLKAVALRHNHVQQDQVWALHVDHLLQPRRVMDGDGDESGAVQNRLHQPDFGWRIVDNQNLGQSGQTPTLIASIQVEQLRGQAKSWPAGECNLCKILFINDLFLYQQGDYWAGTGWRDDVSVSS